MKPILKLIRHASWRWDFAVASHGASFHAPIEVLRILGTSLDKAHEARFELARILGKHGVNTAVDIPDISTKEKAQVAIGLDMKKLQEEKKVFLDTLAPEWDKRAKTREDTYEPKLNL
jgi:nitrite reductase (cytochrome c-552)